MAVAPAWGARAGETRTGVLAVAVGEVCAMERAGAWAWAGAQPGAPAALAAVEAPEAAGPPDAAEAAGPPDAVGAAGDRPEVVGPAAVGDADLDG